MNIPSEGTVNPNVFLGPAIGINMSATYEWEWNGMSGDGDIEDINALDIGLALGGGVEIEMGESAMIIEVRYTLGLTTIDEKPTVGDAADIKNSVISILAGYRF